MSDKLKTCPICHKQMLSHDLAQVNQCMKDFIKKSCFIIRRSNRTNSSYP